MNKRWSGDSPDQFGIFSRPGVDDFPFFELTNGRFFPLFPRLFRRRSNSDGFGISVGYSVDIDLGKSLFPNRSFMAPTVSWAWFRFGRPAVFPDGLFVGFRLYILFFAYEKKVMANGAANPALKSCPYSTWRPEWSQSWGFCHRTASSKE